MFKKLLETLSVSAYTLQTRAGREDLFGKSKRNERDRKLKFEAYERFRDEHPEFQYGGLLDDYDGYIQYRKGVRKVCVFIENESWVRRDYYKLLEDKEIEEIKYEIIRPQDIPKVRYLLGDSLKWEDYFELYKTAFKVMYASVWLNWVMDEGGGSGNPENQERTDQRAKVFNYIYESIKDQEIPFSDYDEFKRADDVLQVLFIADALHNLKLPTRLDRFEWDAITEEDIEFCKSSKAHYYQYGFWLEIFSLKFHKFAGIYEVDIKNMFP
ncbi:hypothetical protein G6675_00055 [Polynucleobacter paneuropaeus]|nr:hypothetical protein [Polynucleobacter paneuropaeus]MBT8599347.1 hypothetical protein [Polynucleobacter paneuropaeus]